MKNTTTDSHKEDISAFADDEIIPAGRLSEVQLLELACKDHDARCAWQSIHLTRDVLQADYQTALGCDFAEKVRDRIEREDSFSDAVVSIADAPKKHNRKSVTHFALWKPVAGLGLAASLAGAAFLFAQLWQAEGAQGTVPDNQVARSSTSTGPLQMVAFQGSRAAQIGNVGTRWRMDSQVARNQQIEQRLNMLLTNHLEDASMGRVHGMLSHSRVVGYDAMPGKQEEF